MDLPLSWTVDDTAGHIVVAVRGDLVLDGTPRLRTALLKCLAEQPHALLVDLAGMDSTEPTALAVFTAVAHQAARWPGTPVLLCGSRPAVRAQLDRGRFGALQTYESVSAALLAIAGGRVSASVLTEQLLPVTGAVRHARDLATEACSAWDLPHLLGPVSLLVSELVSNAVEHAGTMITVQFARRSRYLHLAVRDGLPQEPILDPPPPGSVRRGHGLVLVDSVATHWGTLPTSDGKVVWATLATAAADPAG
jgi:anti-anti-sigma regulatory factor